MSGFEQAWLALRERYDHTDRSGLLAARFAAAVGPGPRLIDLGCGTGSNLRYLAPRLGPDQTWLCLDNDPELLAAAAVAISRWAARHGLEQSAPGRRMQLRGTGLGLDVALIRRDLRNVRRAFSLNGVDGLTASALLDLVSADWLDTLAWRIDKARTPVLFALTYDGRVEWHPRLEADEMMRHRFNAHQRTDKGFGPALGPDATSWLADRLQAHGWHVRLARSDWRMDASDRPLLEAFFEGFGRAAREIEFDTALASWEEARRQQLETGRLRLMVGHSDILGLPG